MEKKHPEFTCDICDFKFTGDDQLKKHIEDEHSTKCTICNETFIKNTDLETHMRTHSDFHCTECAFKTGTRPELENHCQSNHSYTCLFCNYIGIGEETMEDHILEKHAETDENDFFKCDDCTFKTKDKKEYGKHFQDKHKRPESIKDKPNEVIISVNTEETDDPAKLKEEIKVLKSNFARLESIYHESFG